MARRITNWSLDELKILLRRGQGKWYCLPLVLLYCCFMAENKCTLMLGMDFEELQIVGLSRPVYLEAFFTCCHVVRRSWLNPLISLLSNVLKCSGAIPCPGSWSSFLRRVGMYNLDLEIPITLRIYPTVVSQLDFFLLRS
jgi:hypothetical protein